MQTTRLETLNAKASEALKTEHPVYQALLPHQLEQHCEGLLALGVKRVDDLAQLSAEDIDQLGANKFDRATFLSVFVAKQ